MLCLVVIYLILSLSPALTPLPVPCNVSIISINFHHVLRWDPGPGTPPDTQYIVTRKYGEKHKSLNTTATSITLRLKNEVRYYLSLQAFHNQTWSPEWKKTFIPYKDTIIEPPELSLAECGTCIHINISLPENIKKLYSVEFRVVCRRGNMTVGSYKTKENSYTLQNLHNGVEYCIQVHTEIILNQNTKPSAWKCTVTSAVKQQRDSVILGVGATLVILVLGFVITLMFCLYHTGFLCKQKTLPKVLMSSYRGYIMTPEGTIPDPVSMSSVTEKQRNYSYPTITHSDDVSEYEDDEDEIIYMNRKASFSSNQSLCQGSSNMMGSNTPAAVVKSGIKKLSAELGVSSTDFDGRVTHGGHNQAEVEALVMLEESHIEPQGHVIAAEMEKEMKQKTDVFDSPDNVNLFSITLTGLSVNEEEEEGLDRTEPLSNHLHRVPEQTLSNTDSPTDLVDHSTKVLMQIINSDFTEALYEGRHTNHFGCNKTIDANPQYEDVEEEDDDNSDEFSGYMAHT